MRWAPVFPAPKSPVRHNRRTQLSFPRSDRALTPAEVAAVFGVSPKTASQWAKRGKLAGFRTPGGGIRIWATALDPYLRASSGDTPLKPEPPNLF